MKIYFRLVLLCMLLWLLITSLKFKIQKLSRTKNTITNSESTSDFTLHPRRNPNLIRRSNVTGDMARRKHRRRKTTNNLASSFSVKPTSNFKDFVVLEDLDEDGSKIDETLNVNEQQHSPRSTHFDSQGDLNNSVLFESASLPPYDPVTNYLSPRPKFLRYDPDRHREILDRHEELRRMMGNDSSDDEMPVLDDESVWGVDHSVKETDEVNHEVEDNEEYEDDSECSLNVFLQYLLVMVALILITVIICSMNSPRVLPTEYIHSLNVSETEGEATGPMMLMAGYMHDREFDKGYEKRDQNGLTASTKELVAMLSEQPADVCKDDEVGDLKDIEIDKGYKEDDDNDLTVSTKELVAMQHEQPADVCNDDEVGDLKDGEINKGYKKHDHNDLTVSTKGLVALQHEVGDLEAVETAKNNEIDFNKHETETKVSNKWLEPMILTSEKIETFQVEDEIEVYIQLLGAVDLNSSDVNEGSEILKPMVDEDHGNKSLNEKTNSVTKLAYFDPLFAAFSTIAVVIIVSTSVLYCSMHTEASSTISHINEGFDESCSVGSFGSKSIIISEYHESNKDASFSNQTKYFEFQQSTGDSPAHGSFTIEMKMVKKQRSKTPEAMISTVRRSSRIHNRSITSP